MGRPRKPIDYEYEIHRANVQIERFEMGLSTLKQTRKELIQEKTQIELEKLHQMLVESNQPIDAFIEMAQSLQLDSTDEELHVNK